MSRIQSSIQGKINQKTMQSDRDLEIEDYIENWR